MRPLVKIHLREGGVCEKKYYFKDLTGIESGEIMKMY